MELVGRQKWVKYFFRKLNFRKMYTNKFAYAYNTASARINPHYPIKCLCSMPGLPICTAMFCVVPRCSPAPCWMLAPWPLLAPVVYPVDISSWSFVVFFGCVFACRVCVFYGFMLLFVFMLKASSLQVRSLTSEFVLDVFQVEVSKVERSRSVIWKFDFWTFILCLFHFVSKIGCVASRLFLGGVLRYRTNIPKRS